MSPPSQADSGWVAFLLRGRSRAFDGALVFVVAVAIAALSASGRSGWASGDAIEYLESASRVESGRSVPVDSLRPFFLSSLLVPMFRAARVLGSEDGREVIAVVTVAMILASGLAAVLIYRFGERLFGAGPALCGALLLATNRVFNFWSPLAVADVPCAALLAASATAALGAPSPKRALAVGALLGGAVLFKYQAFLPGLVLLAALPMLWRGAPRKARIYASVLAGLVVAVLAQSSLDLVARRPFGATFIAYTRDNVVYLGMGRLIGILRPIFGEEAIGRFAKSWGLVSNFSAADASDPATRFSMPIDFYWTQRHEMFTWMELVFLGIGLVASLRRRTKGAWLPAFVLAVCVYAVTYKGHKEFRIWIALMPFLFPVIGLGFVTSIGWLRERAPLGAAAAAAVALLQGPISILGGVPLQASFQRDPALRQLLESDSRRKELLRNPDGGPTAAVRGWRPWQLIPEPRNPRDFGGYARAAAWLNEHAPRGARVTAIWCWQLSFALRPDLVIALPRVQLDAYDRAAPEMQRELSTLIDSVDDVVGHFVALTENPNLFEKIDTEFRTVAVLEDPIYDESLDTIAVFERLTRGSAPDPWVRVLPAEEAAAALARAPADGRFSFDTVDAFLDKPKPLVECISCTLDREQVLRGHLVARVLWHVPADAVPIERPPKFAISVTNGRNDYSGTRYEIGYGRVLQPRWAPGAVIEQRVPIRPSRRNFDFLETRDPHEALSLDLWLRVWRTGADGKDAGSTFSNFASTGRSEDRGSGYLHVGGLDIAR